MDGCPGLPEEAMRRNAFSLAYYAAFHVVMDKASRDYGYTITHTSNDHRSLRDHLKNAHMVNVANALGRLHVWRKNCDYDDDVPALLAIHENAPRSARKVMEQLWIGHYRPFRPLDQFL